MTHTALHSTIHAAALLSACLMLLSSCYRLPDLHLPSRGKSDVHFELPLVELRLDIYWDYRYEFGINYDWQAEWYYGWDDEDRRIFGELGYNEPNSFNLRRYYTGQKPYAPHTSVRSDYVEGRYFRSTFEWGFWDILAWNDVQTLDGVQSLVFDESSDLESVTAYTNQTMSSARYHAPRYQNSFYEPEQLFAAYEQGIEIDSLLKDFTFDEEKSVWVRQLNMMLEPITYIYLIQVILHNNKGRVTGVEGTANLSGMARTTNLNTGIAGSDAVAVYFGMRLKNNMDKLGELVDIIGGRVLTFGIPGVAANRVTRAKEVEESDNQNHYFDVKMLFSNATDSTFVFNITDQVRKHYKGGVITVELDMDTVPIPQRRGGSGFDAVVKDFEDGGTHEFEM